MEMEFDVIVLGANPYDFVNDNGERLEGLSVHYCSKSPNTKGTFLGLKPEKTSIDKAYVKEFQSVSEFPAIGKAYFTLDPTNRKRPMTITHFSIGRSQTNK